MFFGYSECFSDEMSEMSFAVFRVGLEGLGGSVFLVGVSFCIGLEV